MKVFREKFKHTPAKAKRSFRFREWGILLPSSRGFEDGCISVEECMEDGVDCEKHLYGRNSANTEAASAESVFNQVAADGSVTSGVAGLSCGKKSKTAEFAQQVLTLKQRQKPTEDDPDTSILAKLWYGVPFTDSADAKHAEDGEKPRKTPSAPGETKKRRTELDVTPEQHFAVCQETLDEVDAFASQVEHADFFVPNAKMTNMSSHAAKLRTFSDVKYQPILFAGWQPGADTVGSRLYNMMKDAVEQLEAIAEFSKTWSALANGKLTSEAWYDIGTEAPALYEKVLDTGLNPCEGFYLALFTAFSTHVMEARFYDSFVRALDASRLDTDCYNKYSMITFSGAFCGLAGVQTSCVATVFNGLMMQKDKLVDIDKLMGYYAHLAAEVYT